MKKHIDYIFLISIIIVSIFGLVMIYSSSYIWAEYKFNDPYKYFKNQALFFIIGLIMIFLITKLDINILKKNANKILLISIILLILVLIPGIGRVRNGSRSWFGIGSFGIQPSEATKLALIIFVSKYLTEKEKQMTNIKKGILPVILLTLFVFGLIMLQPDFGTGIIIVMSIMGLLFIGGVPFKFFLYLGFLGIGGIIALIIMAPYRLKRILSFLNPWSDPLGSGFQIIQSLYAIGPGGIFGQGFLNSRQKHFYLPEPQTDFIFAVFASNTGFVGSFLLITLIILFDMHLISLSMKSKKYINKYIIAGILGMLIYQQVQNIGMTIGLLPITGITLPFISYGGSSLLSYFIAIGFILNIYNEKKYKNQN